METKCEPVQRVRITNTTKRTCQTPDRPQKKRLFIMDNIKGNKVAREQYTRHEGIKYIKERHETSVDKILDPSKKWPDNSERLHFKRAVNTNINL